MTTYDDYFDYWCPECKNYVLLEKKNEMLEGHCALCGKDISITLEEYNNVFSSDR